MKGIKMLLCYGTMLLMVSSLNAQSIVGDAVAAEASIANPSILVEAKAPAVIKAKEMTLTLRNNCDKHLNLFMGNKKEVFDGKSEEVGGRSTNTLYLMEGDVVCIMDAPKTIHTCAIIKDGMTKVEINPSGNGFIK